MKSNVEPLEANTVKLSVELDTEEFDGAIDAAFKKIARQVNIPGFRPGKAPRHLVEARVGADAARAQALHDSIPDFYIEALRENDVDAIGQPELKITSGEEEGPVAFEAEVPVRPIPALGGYQGLKVTVPNPVASEEDVDAQIERLRIQFSELKEVDRASQDGDFVTLDLNGTTDGEPVPGLVADAFQYEVGQALQSLGEDFNGKMIGVKAGDHIEFSSTVPPNDQMVDFKIDVKTVSERELPDLTDEWANEVSEFDTVAELRNDISTRLKEVRKAEANRALQTGVIEAIAQLVTEELDEMPKSLVENEMQRQLREMAYRLEQQGFNLAQFIQLTGQDEGAFVESLRTSATQSVAADLGLRSLAAKESLEASDEDVDAEVEALAHQFGQKVARVRRDLEHEDQIPAVRSDIRKAKAVEWLMDNVEIVDSDGNKVEREALRLESETHDHNHEGESEANEAAETSDQGDSESEA
jgi:trigger factor